VFPGIQAGGHAEISRPADGDSVADVVTVLGSASSPDFDHYQLFFGYDPNPTDTWFPIGDPVTTQVSFGRLGIWDTSRITGGTYALRLTVTLEDGSSLEDIVSGIVVRGAASERISPLSGTPASSAAPGIVGTLPPQTALETTPAEVQKPPASGASARGRGIAVGGVLLAGAGAGVMGLIGVGLYVQIRRNLRRRWGALRPRRPQTGSMPGRDREGRLF
jgi:hypothetical protein